MLLFGQVGVHKRLFYGITLCTCDVRKKLSVTFLYLTLLETERSGRGTLGKGGQAGLVNISFIVSLFVRVTYIESFQLHF